jgi:hypothetical protein
LLVVVIMTIMEEIAFLAVFATIMKFKKIFG